jgi:hypothetical protein
MVTSNVGESVVQQTSTSKHHTLDHYCNGLLFPRGASSNGRIIYGVDISEESAVQSLLNGPANLNLHQYNLYHHISPRFQSLQIVAGMKDTWTRPHVDEFGESSWFLLLE